MNHTKNLTGCDTNRHLISMTTPDRLIQLGLNLGFCEDPEFWTFAADTAKC